MIGNRTHLTLDLLSRHIPDRYDPIVVLLLHLLHVKLIIKVVVQLRIHGLFDVALGSGSMRLYLLKVSVKTSSTYIFGQGQVLLHLSIGCKFRIVVVPYIGCGSCTALQGLVVLQRLDLLDGLLHLDGSYV